MPVEFASVLPAALHVSELVHRNHVLLGKHHVVRCELARPTQKHVQKVDLLASLQLVMVVQLDGCAITIVPYHDNNNAVRVVGFLLAL